MIPAMADDPGHGGISRTVTIHGLFFRVATISLNHIAFEQKSVELFARQLTFVQLTPPTVGPGFSRSAQSWQEPSANRDMDIIQEHIMTNLVKRFMNDESGATAIEYGLIAAGISVAIITVVNTLGSQLKSTFTNISSQLATAGK
jgi:pilus assembly protein Flp/PilA